METICSLNSYLNGVKHQLIGDKFHVRQDITLPDNAPCQMAASKLYFTWKGPLLISQHVFFRHVANPTIQDVKQLFESGLQFAKRNNRVPLLLGMNFGYMIINCIISEQETETSIPVLPPIPEPNNTINTHLPSLLQYVVRAPKAHFCVVEFPVLYSLPSQNAHYFRSNTTWGAWMYPIARNIVGTYIER